MFYIYERTLIKIKFTRMKKALFLFLVMAFMNAQAQIQRKLPIREGGQTIDAGNIPESIHANDTTWNQSRNAVRKRPGRVKYAKITLKRGVSQVNTPINSDQFVAAVAKDAKLANVDAGIALNAIFSKLSESLNNGDNLQLIHFGENGNRPDLNNGSNARIADLRKLADELVNLVADEAKLTKADAGNALNAFVANLSNTLRENDNEALSSEKPTYKTELLVTVAENKALRFSLGDPDDDGEGLLDVSAVETDPQDSDGDGYGDYSAMLVLKIDQTLMRNTNTVMASGNKELLDKRHDQLGIRDLRSRDYRHGIRARADKRYEGARLKSREPGDQLVEIITDEDFQVAPQTDIDTKYLRIRNHHTVQVSKGPLQLIAPLLPVQNTNAPVSYLWTITKKEENRSHSSIGSSIVYDFSRAGAYEIEITPLLNDQKLRPYRVLFVIK